MDSPPESSKPTTTSCETAPVQDSPVFSFISNLSPIHPVKAPSVTQGFLELNSPPVVFTSPRLNPHRPSTFLKRAQFLRASAANLAFPDEDGKNSVAIIRGYGKLNIQLSTRLEKGADSNGPENDLTGSPTECPEQFLNDIVNVDSVDTFFSDNLTSEKSECIDRLPDSGTGSKENLVELECESNSRTSEPMSAVPDVSAVEKDINWGDGVSVNQCPEIEHELLVGHALTNRTEEDSMSKNVEAKQAAYSDKSYHLLSGSMELGDENETFIVKASGEDLIEPFLKKVQNDRKALQHRGVRRRCLQFEDARHKVISNQTTQSTSDSEGFRSLPLETPSFPINGRHNEVIQPVLCPTNSLNSTVKIPKPSGIGLHLNSIVNAVQARSGSKVNVRSAQLGNVSIVGKKSTHHLSDYSDSSSVSPLVENVYTDDNRHECHASVGVTSPMSLSSYIAKPSNDSIALNSFGDQSTPGNKRKCSEQVGCSEEFKNLSPQKKRMNLPDPSDGDGCKRCNCKKSKCLKLYCDCFAAGIYCAEPCSCQECFNRPEYEDTVIETRQKIETRDPLAFAPRVVQRVVEQPSMSCGEDGTNFTPASARHKRGCKCKKSMCLKKYCECYQANVGCSDGCRCEGCQNVFGRKGEYCPIKDVLSEEDTNGTTASGNSRSHPELLNAHSLTPPAAAFQFLNRGKDASKAWFPSGEYSHSPESGSTYIAPHVISPGSPINSDNDNCMISENTQEIEILDLASLDHESNAPSLQNWAADSKCQSFSAKRYYYPPGCSLGWHGSPNTPMPQFSGTKLLRNVELSNSGQDDTPEILKDSPTPLNTVKVCSPNKKRVSPPHGRAHGFGSGSSTGIRTGRKFILKAVPSFPPLTPCIDSKSIAIHHADDPRSCSFNK